MSIRILVAFAIAASQAIAHLPQSSAPKVYVGEPMPKRRRKDQGGMAIPYEAPAWNWSERKGKGEKARNRSNRRSKGWI